MTLTRRAVHTAAVAVGAGCAIVVAAGHQDPTTLAAVLDRAGERVEQLFLRAQSIICLEVVRLTPLTDSWGIDGMGRTVESELRLSWTPAGDGRAPTDAQTLRQVLRVNGRKPRANDWNNCTDPEQEAEERQLVSLLLPTRRGEYEFKLAGQTRMDQRPVHMLDYRLLARVSVDSRLIEGRDDCVSFNIEGGKRGRLWIDAESFDVLRVDEHLSRMVDIPLPRKVTRRPGAPTNWTLERMDTSIRFKPVVFTNPDETLVLPSTMSSLRIVRGSGTARLRTTTDYTNYQRFLATGRIVKVGS